MHLDVSGWGMGLHVSNCLHGQSWDCICQVVSMVSRGIAYVKLSPWSDNRRCLFEGLQGVTNSVCISTSTFKNASLAFA
ncbi:hypothetical protein L195_g003403 [Trifolium pratense]|uniref:Uncharacterized protein n=1 Tax=Trifolium pratense TaxID=57577 RepID=A0A2K3NV68_TRIPR|nr:hypothetical protein L195_g003403 [Trifolium pratense]